MTKPHASGYEIKKLGGRGAGAGGHDARQRVGVGTKRSRAGARQASISSGLTVLFRASGVSIPMYI